MRERLLGLAAAWFIRILRRTVRLHHHGDGPLRARERAGAPQIFACWHQHLLLMRYCFRSNDATILISRHRDGEVVAQAMERLGLETVRGSSTRGGTGALKALIATGRRGRSIGVTPDGPKGPAGVVKPGVIAAAAATGLPIQPLALAASRAWRLEKSWDRFLIPKPFSRVHIVYGEILTVERGDDLEAMARELGRRIDAAVAVAERHAGLAGGEAGEVPITTSDAEPDPNAP